MIDFKKEIRLAFSENKKAILISVAILFGSLILGFCLKPYLYDYFNPVVDDLSKQIQSGDIKLTFQSIFSNNIRVVFMSFLFGLLFCFSALILAFNGFFVGYYLATADDLYKALLLVVPHGIFEFSSCILACASGFVLFNFVWRLVKTFSKQQEGSFFKKIYDSYVMNFDKLKQSLILLAVASILMVIAGIFEVYLTIPIAEFIYSMLH